MSLSATARSAPRPLRAPARSSERSRLRLVDAAPRVGGGIGFVWLCALLVLGGLLAMLLLNTARAEGSFVLTKLESRSTELHDRQVTLEAELADAGSAASLAESAEDLGLVPSPSTAVLRLSDGAVLGVATPAAEPPAPTVKSSSDKPETSAAEGGPEKANQPEG